MLVRNAISRDYATNYGKCCFWSLSRILVLKTSLSFSTIPVFFPPRCSTKNCCTCFLLWCDAGGWAGLKTLRGGIPTFFLLLALFMARVWLASAPVPPPSISPFESLSCPQNDNTVALGGINLSLFVCKFSAAASKFCFFNSWAPHVWGPTMSLAKRTISKAQVPHTVSHVVVTCQESLCGLLFLA